MLLFLALLCGWIAYGIAIGHRVALKVKPDLSSRQAVFAGTFAFMLLSVSTAIPVIGGLIGIIVASTSLGAVFLTRFGLRRFIPETLEPERIV